MHVVPITKAPFYTAPGHMQMLMQRLQGMEAGPSDTVWIGCSVLEPGGASPTDVGREKRCAKRAAMR